MSDGMYSSTTREAAQKRRELSPATEEAFQAFNQKVFAEGVLSIRMKQLIADPLKNPDLVRKGHSDPWNAVICLISRW